MHTIILRKYICLQKSQAANGSLTLSAYVHAIFVTYLMLSLPHAAGRNFSGALSFTTAVALSEICQHTHQQWNKRILNKNPLLSCCGDKRMCVLQPYLISWGGVHPPKSAPGVFEFFSHSVSTRIWYWVNTTKLTLENTCKGSARSRRMKQLLRSPEASVAIFPTVTAVA